MIRNSREKELPTKQEEGIVDDRASTSSRLWLGQRNPRIVRVSRAFGGKDRHSKVSTIRGLRDRRVRLSVPTAIQLYDLQDRLGLNQPSKVVDWLLNAAQHEIDKLPPLPMQPGNFIQFSQSLMTHKEETPPQSPSQPHPLSLLSSKSNSDDMGNAVLVDDTPMELGIEKGNFLKVSEVENHEVGIHGAHVEAHESLLRMSHASLSGLLTNSMPYTSYYHLEQSNPYATHMGIHSAQLEVPPASVPGSQLVLCPSGAIPSMFQPYMATSTDFDSRQFGQLQMGSSISQNLPSNPTRTYLLSGNSAMRSFYSNLASKHQHSQDHHGS